MRAVIHLLGLRGSNGLQIMNYDFWPQQLLEMVSIFYWKRSEMSDRKEPKDNNRTHTRACCHAIKWGIFALWFYTNGTLASYVFTRIFVFIFILVIFIGVRFYWCSTNWSYGTVAFSGNLHIHFDKDLIVMWEWKQCAKPRQKRKEW